MLIKLQSASCTYLQLTLIECNTHQIRQTAGKFLVKFAVVMILSFVHNAEICSNVYFDIMLF